MRLNDRSRICATVLISSVLARPGHAGDQAVAAGEERHQHFVDDRVLPDDDLADLGEDALRVRRRRVRRPRQYPAGRLLEACEEGCIIQWVSE